MPIYKLSKADYQKIQDDKQYSFLADNAHMDHGEFMTIGLSRNSMQGLVQRSGINFEFVDSVWHSKEDKAAFERAQAAGKTEVKQVEDHTLMAEPSNE